MSRFVFITTGSLPAPSPAFETLPEHPTVKRARVLPEDGRFTIDGEEWTVRGVAAVALGPDRRPALFVDRTAPTVEIMEPCRGAPKCTFSIGFASPSVIEESEDRPVVITAFGVARGGST